MKTFSFTSMIVALLLFILGGCSSQQSEQLTPQQKEQITKEVKTVLDSIFAKGERLDPEGVLQYYSTDMNAIGDSSQFEFQAYKKSWMNLNNNAAVKWTPFRCEYIVLAKDLVISAWVGKMEVLRKSGDKITIKPTKYTDVYKKIGDQWKVIYEHGSSGMPVIQKADKK